MAKLRLIFSVQGDGRGHLTQALAVRELVRAAGHELVAVLIGHSPRRELPAFFINKIDAPIIPIESFDLVVDKRNRSVSPKATIADNVRRLPRLASGLNVVRRHLDRRRPDIVVNFYEPIVGLAFHFFRPRTRMVAAANQYLFDHPTFEPPLDQKADWKGLRAFNRVTAPPPATKLAFSFQPLPDTPRRRLRVVPPILALKFWPVRQSRPRTSSSSICSRPDCSTTFGHGTPPTQTFGYTALPTGRRPRGVRTTR